MINTAIKYLRVGLSVVPANSSTKYTPKGFRWKKYQSERMIEDKAKAYFHNVDGIAIICGKISGGLEVIDFDNHFGDAEENFTRFCNIKELKPILKDMTAETSPSGGYHIYYRCKTANPSKKIAERWMEKEKRPDAIIEIKGEGGLILCAPSIGYVLIGGSSFDNIKFITEEEKKILYQHMYSFNEYVKPDRLCHSEMHDSGQDRPGDEYSKKSGSITEIVSYLKVAGWKTSDDIHWIRPGKKKGISATLGKCIKSDIPLFFAFSSNAHPFEEWKGYTMFQMFAILQHNGDFKEAAKELAGRGLGKQNEKSVYTEIAKDIHKANKKGIDLKKAIEGIESELSKEEIDRVATNIYIANEEEHNADNKTNIEKAEEFIRKNYDIRFNIIKQKLECKSNDKWEEININTIYCNLLRNWIKFSHQNTTALLRSDFVEKYNPFEEYFESLPEYDGNDYFLKLTKYLSVENKKMFAIMLRKHFVRAIKCALEDHYCNRMVFTLSGPLEEIGKSWLIRWFSPFGVENYYTEEFLKDDKDSIFRLGQNILYNLEEIDNLSKMDINKLKAIISKGSINLRIPYGHQVTSMPRRCTFFGSTNREEFLAVDGNTRWLVFHINSINWDYSKDMVSKNLWIEAYHYYKDENFNCELSKKEREWRSSQNFRYQAEDVEHSLIVKTYIASEDDTYLTMVQIMMKLGELLQGKIKLTASSVKIGRILSSLDFKSGQKKINGKNCRVYYIKEKSTLPNLSSDKNKDEDGNYLPF